MLAHFCPGANSSFAVDLHSLRAAGLAFELKSKGWVMRDLAVHMGPNGLGLQLDVSHGGVKVDGLTRTPPGVPNSAQVCMHSLCPMPRTNTCAFSGA